jgi:hypothetical protein
VVEPEIKTEEDENSGGDGFGEAAVEVHRLVDPVTVAQVPDEAAGVTQSGSLTDGKWIPCLGVTEKRPKKRDKCYPAEGSSPERRGACDRERENLEDAGEYGHAPESQGDSSHASAV